MPIDATQETEAQDLTEQQAVSELLTRWSSKDENHGEKPESEETQEEPEAEQPEGDAKAEDETEATEESAGEIEIDVAGEKFKAPASFAETAKRIEAKAKEVEAGATRKFQEAADVRKAAEVQTHTAKQLQRIAESQADLLADHRMVARRMQQLENVDINTIDTDVLTRLNAEYNQLQAAKTRIEGQYHQNLRGMQEEENKALSAKREAFERTVATRVKGWGTDHFKKLSEYAVSKGAPAGVIQGISESWMAEILDDAAYGHEMRQAKPKAIKRVEATPKTLKPGAAGNPKAAAQAKAVDAMARLKKSGRVEDAAMALLARSANRKR